MPYTDDPENVPADAVRFLIGDTSTTAPDLTDAQIAYLLGEQEDNVLRAAARAAEVQAARYAKQADEKRVGPLWIRSFRSLSANFITLAKTLWKRANTGSAVPWAGGISHSDKITRASYGDRVAPAFRRRMMEYPNASVVGGTDIEERYSPPPETLP